MDFILLMGGLVIFVLIFTLYVYLVETNKIKPHIPSIYTRQTTKEQRGKFYDSETKKFYKWDKLMELHKIRKEKRDDTI